MIGQVNIIRAATNNVRLIKDKVVELDKVMLEKIINISTVA